MTKFQNLETKKILEVTTGKEREKEKIDAREIKGEDYGFITYDFTINSELSYASLLHIESNQEKGSGLGALLVHLFALEVADKKISVIQVPMPATPALGFYAKMGFNVAEEQQKVRKTYEDLGRGDELKDPITITQTSGGTAEVVRESSKSVHKYWALLEGKYP